MRSCSNLSAEVSSLLGRHVQQVPCLRGREAAQGAIMGKAMWVSATSMLSFTRSCQAPLQDGMTELGSHRQAFPGPTALSVRGSGLTRVEQPTDSK